MLEEFLLKHDQSALKKWWLATRYHYVPPSMFPVVIASLVSWANEMSFSAWFFSVVFVTVIINHIALNMTDDYFDYKHAVDHQKQAEKNPYTGGSGVLTSGLIKPRKIAIVFSILYIFVIISGFYLAAERGWIVLLFGLIGLASSIFYTAPPVKFSHHGLGEVTMLLNFGPVLGLGAYFVQTQSLNWEVFIATLPCGIMLFSLIVLNEIPDHSEDIQAGKLTLVARYGKQKGLNLYIIGWSTTYCVIIFGVLSMLLPSFVLFAFISLPWIIRSIYTGKNQLNNQKNFTDANLDNIKGNALTNLGLITGYSLSGFYTIASLDALFIVLSLFVLFYLPAVIPVFLAKSKPRKK